MKITADKILQDIDDYIIEAHREYPRGHLGMSELGRDCPRAIWYSWRIAKIVQHSARLYRLFDRGHKEEKRCIDWLRGAGYAVQDINPETGKQFEVVSSEGYVKGHCDGIISIPTGKGKTVKLIAEFKTANKKWFTLLNKSKSVKITYYDYYCQMQRYMHAFGIQQALFLAVCKDDDRLYPEIVDYDEQTVQWTLERERELVSAIGIPKRMSEDNTFWKCNFCDYTDICFNGVSPIRTCRMCRHIRLPGNAKWYCNLKKKNVSLNKQLKGCKKFSCIQ